jgi:hypothetical protein
MLGRRPQIGHDGNSGLARADAAASMFCHIKVITLQRSKVDGPSRCVASGAYHYASIEYH